MLPNTLNVDLKVTAPVTPRPPVIFAEPTTPKVEAKLAAPVTPKPPDCISTLFLNTD